VLFLLTLNRPHALNALTPTLEAAYFAALAAAERDRDVRAIVVTSGGRGFCAGADLSGSPIELLSGGAPLPDRSPDRYPPSMSTPVIAAVNGACAGVELAIALQADVRFIASEAELTTAFTRRGLAAEHGTAWLLPQLAGRGRALELLLSGRIFSGRDALDYGIAEFSMDADDVLPVAMAYASEIVASCSPTAMAAVKRRSVRIARPIRSPLSKRPTTSRAGLSLGGHARGHRRMAGVEGSHIPALRHRCPVQGDLDVLTTHGRRDRGANLSPR
jgi:enoyl-CoA hydratase/carnithine racemase